MQISVNNVAKNQL